MRDLVAETSARLAYISWPLWMPFYAAWRRDGRALLVSLVWGPVAFPVGVLMHAFWLTRNAVTYARGRAVWNGHTIIGHVA